MASATSGATGCPLKSCTVKAQRRRSGSVRAASRNVPCGEGAHQRSPGNGPAVASRSAALSRTVRETPSGATRPSFDERGRCGIRPREGLRPNTPQADAGMRIEPPPSLACAIGTIPAATAAAAPPLDPPAENEGFHGFLVAPWSCGSVVGSRPNSGVFVRPREMRPARRNRCTSSCVVSAR